MNKVDYLNIIKYFINTFNQIKDIETIKKYFDSTIIDISKEKDKRFLELNIFNMRFLGQKHYDFSFKNYPYRGELSIDFIGDELVNVRCQLFAEGLIANIFGLDKVKIDAEKYLTLKFGKPKPIDFKNIDQSLGLSNLTGKSWINSEYCMYISLSTNKKQVSKKRYISIGIERLNK